MTINCHIQVDEHILRSEWSGVVTIADVRQYFVATRADPAVTASMSRLLDLRQVTTLPRTEQLREMATLTREYRTAPEPKIAILAASDIGFGVSMMFKAFSGFGDRLFVFREEAEALAWLVADSAVNSPLSVVY